MQIVIAQSELLIQMKQFEQALHELGVVIQATEDDREPFWGGKYTDDDVSEYRHFDNPREQSLYMKLCHPTRRVESVPEDYPRLYALYGLACMELKRYGEAKAALQKSLRWNPVKVDTLCILAELCKRKKKPDEYLETLNECLDFSCAHENSAQCYRDLGRYYAEAGGKNTAKYPDGIPADPTPENAASEVLELIENMESLRKNIDTLDDYLSPNAGPEEHSFAETIVFRGKCYVVVGIDEHSYMFYPSRFLGYENNSMARHKKWIHCIDGRETNKAITKVLKTELITSGKNPDEWKRLERAYAAYCSSVSIPVSRMKRKYWPAIGGSDRVKSERKG
ncbi:MAG: hypothetical protein LBP21_08335 [Synergistaceae bacterium]|nr:hypothetical protein [Synergistaceae bacterium]